MQNITLITNTKANTLFGTKFELIDTGFHTGEFNMKFDVDRMTALSNNLAFPMFRLYGWQPHAVSLGAHQSESEIDMDECLKRNFDLVRRPTGGRAVLHAHELTYSVVTRIPQGLTIHDLYREIHTILMSALSKICGDGLEFEKSQPNFRDFYKSSEMSVSCFASSARYEVAWQGKKLIGSAQRLFGDVLLQHGSILLGSGHEILAYLAKNKDEAACDRLAEFILNHSATLEQVADREVTYDECRDAIANEILL